MSYKTALIIGSGGFIGAVSRAYLTGFFARHFTVSGIAVGTLGVNLLGSIVIGILFALFSHTSWFSPSAKSFLSTGLLGALTTYSTFALENLIMLQHGQYANLMLNISANVIGTLIAVTVGYTLMLFLIR